MEDLGGTRFEGLNSAVRKKRSQTFRRPRPESQPFSEGHDQSASSTPPSDDMSKVSSDENAVCDTDFKRKEFNLNQCVSRISSAAGSEDEKPHKKNKKDGGFNMSHSNDPGRSGLYNKRCSEGVLAPANWKNTSKLKEGLDSESRSMDIYGGRNGESLSPVQSGVLQDGLGNENRVKKVKLKVGGVTRTIQANSTSNGASGNGSSTKSSRSSEASRSRQNSLQGNSDDNRSPTDKRSCLQGIPWKDFSRGGFDVVKEDSSMAKISGKKASGKQGDKAEPVRKSKRVPKRRVLDGEFGDEDDEDEEIRYLEKLKTSKVSAVYREDDEESSKKHRKLSSVSNMENVGASRPVTDGKKKSRSDSVYEDTDYEEEEGTGSDGELEGKKKKKQKKESVDFLMDGKREMTLTTRQRALQSSKDASAPGGSLIEFPNGLPPAPPRKQKEKLSEVEQQLKKSEAAQRRRMQVEKAARESEAAAIKKILGQDSNRKKQEDKSKKRREELAQEKAANALMLASNTVRWVMGPTGTVVTFPEEMGLPSIFNSKPISYPPPRENCAGPSCNNPYRYRDSKSKLPLCSLQCYKAIRDKMGPRLPADVGVTNNLQ
ncbi:HIT zinc finger,PAPA-1-like conserved region isoform 1 [Quillaja saponaria]|uniref:HIT zinc finger,PAPA-1-like conserved region isoform 1 n=1 Tax=Quillaja saponaria TaxID=32244 RepID=A0AAD7Q1E3_QUISA|nr:HIT zinc finger,PAPA-1-like conserved region isoform 1 [Quillaja saponaria]